MKKSDLEKENDKNAIALFKYAIIAPIVNNIHETSSKAEFFRQAASKKYTLANGKQSVLSADTIKKWYLDYCRYGFDCLKPKSRNDAGLSRKIPSNCIDKIQSIKEQFPHITGKAIYNKLIDDASRLIVGYQFFLRDNALNFQIVLKQAIKTYGVPKRLFVDNGTPYNLVVLVLVGQPTLNDILSRSVHEALNQRIIVNYMFMGIEPNEVKNYIIDRCKIADIPSETFDESAIKALSSNCNGSTRVLNSLIDKSLLICANKNENVITNETVMLAANDLSLMY